MPAIRYPFVLQAQYRTDGDGPRSSWDEWAQMVELAGGYFDLSSRNRWTAQQRLRYGVELIGGTRKAAKEAGIPLSSLSRYLSGQSKVPLSVLRQVAIAAGYSPDHLIAGMSEQLGSGLIV